MVGRIIDVYVCAIFEESVCDVVCGVTRIGGIGDLVFSGFVVGVAGTKIVGEAVMRIDARIAEIAWIAVGDSERRVDGFI